MISTRVTSLRKSITKGNRRRTMRRVPKSCGGYCSGFLSIRSSSSRNIPAARLLRCMYQSTAASASSSAAGWIRRDSALTAPAGREGGFVRCSRGSGPRFHRQSASGEARSPASTLPPRLRRGSNPGFRSVNRSARNAPRAARRGRRERVPLDGSAWTDSTAPTVAGRTTLKPDNERRSATRLSLLLGGIAELLPTNADEATEIESTAGPNRVATLTILNKTRVW